MNEKYLVTQANDLIVSRHNLKTAELKIVLSLVSLIQPEDDNFKTYRLKINEFQNLLGLTGHSKYNDMLQITKDLTEKAIQIKSEKRTLQMTWLASVDYKHGEGIVELEISQKLRPYLLGLKEYFTTYSLENILKLNSKYAIRLYEILKSNEYKKTVIIELNEIIELFLLNEKTYSIFQNFKSRIIEPAKREINEKTDIQFEYEFIKTGKKVTALKFIIKPNPKNQSQKLIQEPPKLLNESNGNNQSSQLDDIKAVKAEFQRRYKGELADKFIKEMITEKGFEHIQRCIRNYANYIKERNINNIAGDFYCFVMEGYQKPIPHKGKKTQRDNFEQREYSREECEKWEQAFLDEPASKLEPKNYTYINP